MPQLTYNFDMSVAVAGMVSDSRAANIISRAAEGDVDFGLALIQGTDPKVQVKVPLAAAGVFEGISVESWNVVQVLSTNTGLYKDTESVPVLRKGKIWVHIDQDISINDPVYFRHTGGNEGYFRKDADTGNADLVPTGVFRGDATAASGIAEIEINLP